MKNLLTSLLLLLFISAFAQTGIGTTTPDASAQLEVASTTKGFLPPRMTLTQMNVITSPAEGLLVYCLDCDPKGPYYYDGTDFLAISTTAISIVEHPTTANAGIDINPVTNADTATLTGNTPIIGTGAWSVVSGTATITTPSSPVSGVTGLAVPGVATLRWTISNGPYTSTDDVIITTSFSIHETYQGGIIAYIFQSGDTGYIPGETHGIIVATDQETAPWGCDGVFINIYDYDTVLGTGNQNTIDIENRCLTPGTAADYCANYTNTDTGTGVYSDWYLPSKGELSKLATNRAGIVSVATANGWSILWDVNYWSSSEATKDYAWFQDLTTGVQNYNNKGWAYFVSPIRNF